MEAHADEAGVTLLLGGVGLARAGRSGVTADARVKVTELGEEGFLFLLLLVIEAPLHGLAIKASLELLLPFLVAPVTISRLCVEGSRTLPSSSWGNQRQSDLGRHS